MTQTGTRPYTLTEAFDQFTRELDRSTLTVQAYVTDIRQFLTWLNENDFTVTTINQVTRSHINEYLKYIEGLGRTNTTRRRKLAALKVFFKFLASGNIIAESPAASVKCPKKEKKRRDYLKPDEYNRVLALAGGHPRDFAILQVFLQTGIRVSELIAIELKDLNVEQKTLLIHGKGQKEREIPLEKKALQALKSWLSNRPQTHDTHLFLNYTGMGLSLRGVRKLVDKYVHEAGITKQISCHGLRRTCLTNKAARNMNAFAIQKLAGHEEMETTRLYVMLGTEELRPLMEATSL